MTLTPDNPVMAAHVVTHDTQMLATERCDRCGAHACVAVVLPSNPGRQHYDPDGLHTIGPRPMLPAGGILLLCGHHYRDHEQKILATAAMVQDHRGAPEPAESHAKTPH
jgi:hypothetical protein